MPCVRRWAGEQCNGIAFCAAHVIGQLRQASVSADYAKGKRGHHGWQFVDGVDVVWSDRAGNDDVWQESQPTGPANCRIAVDGNSLFHPEFVGSLDRMLRVDGSALAVARRLR